MTLHHSTEHFSISPLLSKMVAPSSHPFPPSWQNFPTTSFSTTSPPLSSMTYDGGKRVSLFQQLLTPSPLTAVLTHHCSSMPLPNLVSRSLFMIAGPHGNSQVAGNLVTVTLAGQKQLCLKLPHCGWLPRIITMLLLLFTVTIQV